MTQHADQLETMAIRILAVLASDSGTPKTIDAVLQSVALDWHDTEQAIFMLGVLTSRKLIKFVDEYRHDVPLASLRVQAVPFDPRMNHE